MSSEARSIQHNTTQVVTVHLMQSLPSEISTATLSATRRLNGVSSKAPTGKGQSPS